MPTIEELIKARYPELIVEYGEICCPRCQNRVRGMGLCTLLPVTMKGELCPYFEDSMENGQVGVVAGEVPQDSLVGEAV